MKILYVHELYPPEAVGGGETYVENLAKEMKKRKIDVTVLTGTGGKTKTEKVDGITVHRINFWPSRYFFNIKAYFAMKKIVKEFKPDIIHANTYHSAIPSSMISKKYKIPVILSLHNLFLKETYRYLNPVTATFFYLFERLMFVFPYTEIMALDYCTYDNSKKISRSKNIILIPHPIDTSSLKMQKHEKHKKIIVGTAVTMAKAKRNKAFLSLANNYKNNSKIQFVAFGRYDDKMKRSLERSGIKSYGFIKDSEKSKYFNMIDVYIGQGMAAKEAMACGCITVLNESSERLLKYHKPEIEAGAMLINPEKIIVEMLIDNSKFDSIRKKASEFVKKNYSKETIMSKIINEYKKLIR